MRNIEYWSDLWLGCEKYGEDSGDPCGRPAVSRRQSDSDRSRENRRLALIILYPYRKIHGARF